MLLIVKHIILQNMIAIKFYLYQSSLSFRSTILFILFSFILFYFILHLNFPRYNHRYNDSSLQVLITKLWSTTNAETQQYRKASKALLVLIPLLGVTYVLVLTGPTEGQVANAFSYTRAAFLSSQVMQLKDISRYKN